MATYLTRTNSTRNKFVRGLVLSFRVTDLDSLHSDYDDVIQTLEFIGCEVEEFTIEREAVREDQLDYMLTETGDGSPLFVYVSGHGTKERDEFENKDELVICR